MTQARKIEDTLRTHLITKLSEVVGSRTNDWFVANGIAIGIQTLSDDPLDQSSGAVNWCLEDLSDRARNKALVDILHHLQSLGAISDDQIDQLMEIASWNLRPPASLTWLHLSDIHLRPDKRSEWYTLFDELIKDLKRMNRRHMLQPDLLFITGDVADGQRPGDPADAMSSQFAEAAKLIDTIRKSFPTPVPVDNVFLIPGNHDVWRGEIVDWINRFQDNATPAEYAGILAKKNLLDDMLKRLSQYDAFISNSGFDHCSANGRLGFAQTRVVNSYKIGIVGFNSAWTCRRDKEYGQLYLGYKNQAANHYQLVEDCDITFALSHHPFNWFFPGEMQALRAGIQKQFSFFLHGHEHQGWIETIDQGCVRVGAPALFQGEDNENGYSFGRIDIEGKRGEIWLRRYDSASQRWSPRIIDDAASETGRHPLNSIRVRRQRPGPAKKPVRRVATSAVQSDVAQFRHTVLFGDAPFLNRDQIRHALEKLSSEAGPGVISVSGAPRSGQTYVWDLIFHAAQRGDFYPAYVDGAKTQDMEMFSREIAGYAGIPKLSILPDEPTLFDKFMPNFHTTDARMIKEGAERFATALRDEKRKYWLVLDNFSNTNISKTLEQFAQEIASRVARGQYRDFLRVVLLNSENISRVVASLSLTQIAHLTVQDIEERDVFAYFRERFGLHKADQMSAAVTAIWKSFEDSGRDLRKLNQVLRNDYWIRQLA